jgi:phage replication O-like protein O
MNGNPELNDKFTQIPNELLITLARTQMQGLITGRERSVIDFIIRNTYGYHKESNTLRTSFIAKELETTLSNISKILKRLEEKNIIIRDGSEITINKHYQEWRESKLPYHKSKLFREKFANSSNIAISGNKTLQSVATNIAISGNIEPEQKQLETEPVDVLNKTIKYNINKTIRTCNNEKQEISLKDEKQEKAKELIIQFCSFRNIPVDAGFFSKNIRSARSLVSYYPVELVLAGIVWRLKNDSDNFWNQKLWSLNSVYSHFAEWIAQSKLKTEKTFTDWLIRNPREDYRSIEEPNAKIKAFFVAFNRALKDGICPTPQEWGKYQKARELNNESLRIH